VDKKKVLLISDWLPFPPKNGMQLPVAEYISHLNNIIDFDLFLIGDNQLEYEKNLYLSVPYFKNIKRISSFRKSKFLRILNEFSIHEPYYSEYSFDHFDVSSYHSVWFSNAKIASLSKNKLFEKSNLFLMSHDAIYYSYYERLKSTIFGNNQFNISMLFDLFRLPFILLNERSYLSKFNSIQVQTDLEKNRLKKISSINANKIHVIPNGIKSELISFSPDLSTNNILFMSHMILGKEILVNSFLKNVWQKVVQQNPDLHLYIVGALPDDFNPIFYNKYINVHFTGYIENLFDIFKSKSLTIIPNYQSSGLINRLFDTICAGVPFVVSKKIAETHPVINHLQIGKVANSDDHFVFLILDLLSNKEMLVDYSKNAKLYSNNLNSWESSADKLKCLF
jgi:glycosyltransferase involved in cell wall biosynthesis